MTWVIFRTRETATARVPVDLVGLGLLILWVGALQVMLDKGKELDWFNSPQILVLLGVGVVAFALFLIWELTEEHPIVDLSSVRPAQLHGGDGGAAGRLRPVLRQRRAAAAVAAAVHGIHRNPRRSGAGARGLLAIFLSPLVGRFSDRFDPRVLVTVSFAVFALVLFMRAQFNTNATIGTLLIPTIIQGAGMAAFFIPLMSITLSGLPPERIPAASGLSNFARITAGSFGTSITTTLWDRRATLHHAQLVEHLNAGDPVTSQALGTLHSGGFGTDRATSCSTGWWTRRRSCCRRTISSTPQGSSSLP